MPAKSLATKGGSSSGCYCSNEALSLLPLRQSSGLACRLATLTRILRLTRLLCWPAGVSPSMHRPRLRARLRQADTALASEAQVLYMEGS